MMPRMPPKNNPVPAAPTAFALRANLRAFASPEQAKITMGFFKTGPGEYAEGDRFIGVKVPVVRKLIKPYFRMPMTEIQALLHSPIHEDRLAALLLLVARFDKGGAKARKEIYDFYLAQLRWINNWDLVDASAAPIVGAWLQGQDRAVLRKMAKSENMWERRVAMTATHHFIKNGESGETFVLAAMLLEDEHDLIHKAVGWMLREVGNRDREAEERFLRRHRRRMPRTMLRYAIEKFPEPLRRAYLSGAALPASSAPGEVSGSA